MHSALPFLAMTARTASGTFATGHHTDCEITAMQFDVCGIESAHLHGELVDIEKRKHVLCKTPEFRDAKVCTARITTSA